MRMFKILSLIVACLVITSCVPDRVVLIGDSLTEGYCSGAIPCPPNEAYSSIVKFFVPNTVIAGCSGSTTATWVEEPLDLQCVHNGVLITDPYTHEVQPIVAGARVVILLGVNDSLVHGIKNGFFWGLPLTWQEYQANLNTLIDKLQADGAVSVAIIKPQIDKYTVGWDTLQKILLYGFAIDQIVLDRRPFVVSGPDIEQDVFYTGGDPVHWVAESGVQIGYKLVQFIQMWVAHAF